ncbi:MAG: hypothetical protein HFH85_00455 [Lachnospiraceae bacterium]|jgi:hypothetical protein|nr:hypothetical protein [Lachnospiraceae bacterium]
MGFRNNGKLFVGYDLGSENAQISYALSEEGDVETLSQVAGAEKYNIPAFLFKRYGVNQWLYGREALRLADGEDGILVGNLLDMALDGEPVVVDGESYDPIGLLALFFKRSLSLLSQVGTKIGALMVTCPVMDRKILEVLGSVVSGIHLKAEQIFFQSYAESFYGYMLRQPEELWNYPALLFDYGAEKMKVYRMESNKRTTPIVVFIEESEYEPPDNSGQAGPEEMDAVFQRIAEEVCGKSIIGSVFLIGDRFAGDWMKNSLRFLCRGRRVFQGNNLFSKGACCGMQERMAVSEMGRTHVFLGNDKLKANIGMKLLRNGAESYYALLDAGVNWYEAEHTMEIYVQDGNEILLTVTPLIGGGSGQVRVVLEGLAEGISRLRLHFFLKAEDELVVEAEDLGFGDFRASSGRIWRDEIEIYQEIGG